jgi:hypothetical protein
MQKNIIAARIDFAQNLHIAPFQYPGGSKLTSVALDCATFRRGTSPENLLKILDHSKPATRVV